MSELSKSDCEKWFAKPTVNPITKRDIQVGKGVYKKLEKDCAKYKSKSPSPPVVRPVSPPIVRPVTPPVVRPVSPPIVRPVSPPIVRPVSPPIVRPVSPRVEGTRSKGRKLSKVRKGDCLPPDMIWEVGSGCFQYLVQPKAEDSSKADEKPVPPPVPKIELDEEKSGEWRKYPLLKSACVGDKLRWVYGRKGVPGHCEAHKDFDPIADREKVLEKVKDKKKQALAKIVKRPQIELTKEEIDAYAALPEPKFLKRLEDGSVVKDCLNETAVVPAKLDIKKHSFTPQQATAHYIFPKSRYSTKVKPSFVPEVEKWYNDNQTLVSQNFVLSESTRDWLKNYLDGKYMFKTVSLKVPLDILKNCQQFRFDKPILLFRGIHFGLKDFRSIEKFCGTHINPNTSYTFADDKPSSWTWNYTMAENFAKIGSFGFVLMREFKPEEILIDLRLCPEYLILRGLSPVQDEVIVLPGKHKSQVIFPYPPGTKNALLTNENLTALKALSMWYARLNPFSKTVKLVPYLDEGNFGADYAGLLGTLIYKDFSLYFDITPSEKDEDLAILHYGVGPKALSEEQMYSDPKTTKTFDPKLLKKIKSVFDLQKLPLDTGKVSSMTRYAADTSKIKDIKQCEGTDSIYKRNCYVIQTHNQMEDSLLNIVKKFTELADAFKSL